MTEKEINDYNKWLTEVWAPDLHIPFISDTSRAYNEYAKREKLSKVCKSDYCLTWFNFGGVNWSLFKNNIEVISGRKIRLRKYLNNIGIDIDTLPSERVQPFVTRK